MSPGGQAILIAGARDALRRALVHELAAAAATILVHHAGVGTTFSRRVTGAYLSGKRGRRIAG